MYLNIFLEATCIYFGFVSREVGSGLSSKEEEKLKIKIIKRNNLGWLLHRSCSRCVITRACGCIRLELSHNGVGIACGLQGPLGQVATGAPSIGATVQHIAAPRQVSAAAAAAVAKATPIISRH